MGIIQVFLIFGLVMPVLSFILLSEGKCSVYITHLCKCITKRSSVLYQDSIKFLSKQCTRSKRSTWENRQQHPHAKTARDILWLGGYSFQTEVLFATKSEAIPIFIITNTYWSQRCGMQSVRCTINNIVERDINVCISEELENYYLIY